MTLEPIRTVGRYDLLEVIGRGGAAVVYLAHQRDLRRRVALKELSPAQAGDPTFAARFLDESRLAGSLSHPNIVTVHEFFTHEDVPYIAMEHLAQGSLRAYVGILGPAQIVGVLEGVLAGLAHGQRHAVVHRDLKPENLLVSDDGRVKIADFGVARAYNDAITREVVTAMGTTIGTPAYMAPEQALGHAVGPATDLYSLGIVAWELLVGRVPFPETDTPVAVLYQQVHEPVPSVRSLNPDVDPAVEEWLNRLLAKDPGARFAGAEEAWERLEDLTLDLLGPRWRRDARLPVAADRLSGPPLTPAAFSDPAGADAGGKPAVGGTAGSTGRRTRRAPIESPPARAPSKAAPARAPMTLPPRSSGARHTTLHRLALRHRDAPQAEEVPDGLGGRRTLAIGLAAAALAAGAVAGVLLGQGGSDHPRRVRVTAPDPKPALVGILRQLSTARTQGLAQFNAATSPTAQASAAGVLAAAYASAVRELDALSPALRATAPARSLRATLSGLQQAYLALGAAAQAGSATRFAAARAQISAGEQALRSENTRL